MVEKICPECGAAFMPTNGNQVCCSAPCKRERMLRQIREWEREHGHDRPSRDGEYRRNRRLKLSARQRMLANLRQRDALAPKPRTEVIYRNGIIIERRGTVPAGCHAADFIRHNA